MSDTFKELLETGIYYPDHVSDRAKKIIDWCLEYDPKRRPICSHLLTEISKYRKQASQSSTDNSSNVSHTMRYTTSQSFLNTSTPSSTKNLSFYQNVHNTQNPKNIQTIRLRDSNLQEPKKHDILRPKLESKYAPETAR